ncbi:MAG TPA: reverse transcriptase family protein, partial [Chroococcales cyanobacterium]
MVQRLLLEGVIGRVRMPPHVHGCVKGRSIVTNAAGHVGKALLINIDLSDFFGSVHVDRVNRIFREKLNCDAELAEILTGITTYGNFLPQGAPTSPALANLAALEMDDDIMQACSDNVHRTNWTYTRYVDDITISGGNELAPLLKQFYSLIEKHGFRANPKKLRVARPSQRQNVTGVTVNQRLNPSKKLIRRVRQQLYYCKKFGFENHCESQKILPHVYWRQVKGMIGYLRMTRPELADEFDILLHSITKVSTEFVPDEQEMKIRILKRIIDDEKTATFTYQNSLCKVAPSEVWMDDDGHMVLRAFQLSPEQGWRVYSIYDIEGLVPSPGGQ